MAIADRYNLAVIEDAAQAFGAHSRGKKAGSFGIVSSFSMNPMKVYGAYGEAGAVLTDDLRFYELVKSLRYNGTINKEECHYVGLNGRLDTLQAAMLLVALKRFPERVERRRNIARFYNRALGSIVRCPQEQEGNYDIYYTYTIITDKRDELKEYLQSKGIETKIHHPILMPQQKAYQHLRKCDTPVAARLVKQILSIPNHEHMSI